MKLPKKSAVSAALLTACALTQIESAHAQIPAVPSGTLSANPTMIQNGAATTLAWNINYPSVVKDYIKIVGSSIEAKEAIDVEVRVIGNGVTAGIEGSTGFTFVPAEASISFNGGAYSRIFYGANPAVVPANVVWNKVGMLTGQKIGFGGKYFYNNAWGTIYNSTTESGKANPNVRTLVKGDSPPNVVPANGAPSLEQFLRPYLDTAGKVNIGPMDCIVFMELTHVYNTSVSLSQQSAGYDLQDMVLLVTCKKAVTTTTTTTTSLVGINSGATGGPASGSIVNLDINPAINGVIEGP
jgi:hypothetical protein